MKSNISAEEKPQSLAEILEEEMNAECGNRFAESDRGEEEQRLEAAIERIHSADPPRTALCLSGGGIRSATFGLGVLQGLAKKGLLGKFDYLSTVSGGGFVGGWLSGWIKQEAKGSNRVFEQLSEEPEAKLSPEWKPIRHLRAYSNYLTPRLGFLSADTWTLFATFLRNIILNWIVLLSWLTALLIIPRLLVFAVLAQPGETTLMALIVGAMLSLAAATANAAVDLPSMGNARWSQKRFLVSWLVPMLVASSFYFAWWAGYRNTSGMAVPFMSSLKGLLYVQFYVALVGGSGTRDRMEEPLGNAPVQSTVPSHSSTRPWATRPTHIVT